MALAFHDCDWHVPRPLRRQLFDNDWKFHRGDIKSAHLAEFDDNNWKTLDLPHNWSIVDLPENPVDGKIDAG